MRQAANVINASADPEPVGEARNALQTEALSTALAGHSCVAGS